MSKQLRELQVRKTKLVKVARLLTDRATAENRDLSDDDVIAFDTLRAKIDVTSAAIDRDTALGLAVEDC